MATLGWIKAVAGRLSETFSGISFQFWFKTLWWVWALAIGQPGADIMNNSKLTLIATPSQSSAIGVNLLYKAPFCLYEQLLSSHTLGLNGI